MDEKPILTESQKRIMAFLLEKPATPEAIGQGLKLAYGPVIADLKALLERQLVEKEGYPTTYRLAAPLEKRIEGRKTIAEKDPFDLRLRCVIEAQGVEESLVQKGLNDLEKALRSETDHFTVYECNRAPPHDRDGHYSAYLETELSVKDFKSLIHLLFYYGPVGIEVLRPRQITLRADDLQDALVDASLFVHRYTNLIAAKLKRDEIEKFNQDLARTHEKKPQR